MEGYYKGVEEEKRRFFFLWDSGAWVIIEKMCEIERVNQQREDFNFSEVHYRKSER